jgi:hypothetical protein
MNDIVKKEIERIVETYANDKDGYILRLDLESLVLTAEIEQMKEDNKLNKKIMKAKI